VAQNIAQRGTRYDLTVVKITAVSKERYAKHSRECEAVEEIARAAPASEPVYNLSSTET
jgi:hypothetical protein